jgi:hypothetical protein
MRNRAELTDASRVVIGDGESTLTIGRPVRSAHDHRSMSVPIHLRSDGLVAETSIECEGWGAGSDGLIAFFTGLDRDWRGWAGVREWRDDIATCGSKHGMTESLTCSSASQSRPTRAWAHGARPRP